MLLFSNWPGPFPVQRRSALYGASGTSSSDVKRALLETHVFLAMLHNDQQDDDRSRRYLTPVVV